MGGAAGGLCDRRAYGRSFNTLALAHATADDKDRIPERIAALTLAHEMGEIYFLLDRVSTLLSTPHPCSVTSLLSNALKR